MSQSGSTTPPQSDAPRKPGPQCTSMADVRREIDRLDRELVALLAKRQTYMDAAARLKSDRGTVRDTTRIEEVVSKVLASAREAGLSERIAEPVWRTLIERSIAYEYEIWDGLRAPQETKSA